MATSGAVGGCVTEGRERRFKQFGSNLLSLSTFNVIQTQMKNYENCGFLWLCSLVGGYYSERTYVFMVANGHSKFLGTICDSTLRTQNYWVSGLSPSSGILNTN
jgi:hypothetical protein